MVCWWWCICVVVCLRVLGQLDPLARQDLAKLGHVQGTPTELVLALSVVEHGVALDQDLIVKPDHLVVASANVLAKKRLV